MLTLKRCWDWEIVQMYMYVYVYVVHFCFCRWCFKLLKLLSGVVLVTNSQYGHKHMCMKIQRTRNTIYLLRKCEIENEMRGIKFKSCLRDVLNFRSNSRIFLPAKTCTCQVSLSNLIIDLCTVTKRNYPFLIIFKIKWM